jgi:MutS domain V
LHVLARGASSEKAVTEEASLAWAREKLPSLGVLQVLAFALPGLTLGLFVLGYLGYVPSAAWSFSATFSIVVAMLLGPRLQPYFAALELALPRYQSIFYSLEQAKLRAPELMALQAVLKKDAKTSGASDALAKLARVASFANARNNEIFRFVIGPVLQWDLHAALALGRVHEQLHADLPAWFAALGQFDAFSALGSYAFEHEDFAWPDLVDAPDFEVTALAHPLLPVASRKSNTLSLAQLHIVTGSNMAGKSTLLRAVGLATVLAYAGAPVCASKLRLGYFRVVTSMRIRDSVGDGVSRFYAELAKLKRVMSGSSEAQTLVLLDEILSGTNMRERVIGARGLIAELGRRNAKGLVSTHDLELTTLPGVRNVHFEEQVNGEVMTFDYTKVLLKAGTRYGSCAPWG